MTTDQTDQGRRPVRTVGRALLVAFVLLPAACSSAVLDPSDEVLHDESGGPRWASIVVVGDPPVAPRGLDLALIYLPERQRLRSTHVPAGTVVRWEEGVSANPYRLEGPGCSLDVTLPPERATTVVLTVTDVGCSFRLDDSAAPKSVGGHLMAHVTLRPWAGLRIRAISLDTPAQPVPEAVPPDEGGLAQLGPLLPGRYAIELLRGEAVVERKEIVIEDRRPAGHLLEITLDGVPGA